MTFKELLIKSILSFPRRRESMRNKVLDPRLRGDDELISASLSAITLKWNARQCCGQPQKMLKTR